MSLMPWQTEGQKYPLRWAKNGRAPLDLNSRPAWIAIKLELGLNSNYIVETLQN